jgi:adenylate cyclase
MPQEIERKFLVQGDRWRSLSSPKLYRQGYIDTDADRQVWIQINADRVLLSIQSGPQSIDLTVPPEFGAELWQLSDRSSQTQGQLRSPDGLTLRPRIVGNTGIFTIKTRSVGIARSEYEWEISLDQATALLDHCCDRPLIEKYRTKIPHDGLIWEVDEFLGDNQGLILAEVELASADQTVHPPDWIGPEVSGDRRYFNSYLAQHPFPTWGS